MQYKPPLCFRGNKGNCRKEIINIVETIPKDELDNITFVDLFGGSCFVSYCIKYNFPQCKVICNDYDDYINRLKHIEDTNEILNRLHKYLNDNDINKKKQKLQPKEIEDIKNILRQAQEDKLFIDVICLSSNILFSGNYCTSLNDLLKIPVYYNRFIKSSYDTKKADEYLDVLNQCEIIRDDYKNIYNSYKDKANIIFIADPPYLYTDKTGYSAEYWKLSDSIDVLDIFYSSKCIFFTSPKSGHLDLMKWFDKKFNTNITYKTIRLNRPYLHNPVERNEELMLYNF